MKMCGQKHRRTTNQEDNHRKLSHRGPWAEEGDNSFKDSWEVKKYEDQVEALGFKCEEAVSEFDKGHFG